MTGTEFMNQSFFFERVELRFVTDPLLDWLNDNGHVVRDYGEGFWIARTLSQW